MITGSKRLYSISEIRQMVKEGWSDDFKAFITSAPPNVQKYLFSLSETNCLPADDTLLNPAQSDTVSANENTTDQKTVLLPESNKQNVAGPMFNTETLSKNADTNSPATINFSEESHPTININNTSINHSTPDTENDIVHVERQKPTSSLTFFYKPSLANNSKKKTQGTNSPLLLHIFDGYDCPICGNKLYITNIVVKFGAKSEVKFPADFCKRCAKHFIPQERLDEIKPSLQNRPNFDYSIIDLEEK